MWGPVCGVWLRSHRGICLGAQIQSMQLRATQRGVWEHDRDFSSMTDCQPACWHFSRFSWLWWYFKPTRWNTCRCQQLNPPWWSTVDIWECLLSWARNYEYQLNNEHRLLLMNALHYIKIPLNASSERLNHFWGARSEQICTPTSHTFGLEV